jgi:hypothetical protein
VKGRKMKGRIILTIVTLLALFAVAVTPSIALAGAGCQGITVDIGDPASETQTGVAISGWGPVEPSTNGGNWGGQPPDNCRVVYDPQGTTSATVTYSHQSCVYPTCLEWNALDGVADDSYTVSVDGVIVYTYTDTEPINDPEAWGVKGVDLTQFQLKNDIQHVVEFVATGQQWDYFVTYGQVAIDYVTLGTAACESGTEVGVEVVVLSPDCICIDVTPTSLSFGSLFAGQSKTIANALTIKNCGNVNAKVTATTGTFYTANLAFDLINIASWFDVIAVSASDTIDATLTVPGGTAAGPATGQIVFWAVKN